MGSAGRASSGKTPLNDSSSFPTTCNIACQIYKTTEWRRKMNERKNLKGGRERKSQRLSDDDDEVRDDDYDDDDDGCLLGEKVEQVAEENVNSVSC